MAFHGDEELLPPVEEFEARAGLGARGTVEGRRIEVGRRRGGWVVPPCIESRCAEWEAGGRTSVLVASEGQVIAAVALSDTLRPEAEAMVRRLHELGLRCVLVTGDNETTARAIAAAIGIEEVFANASPVEKVRVVEQLRAGGRAVAMIGDGVNDGPALVAADLGLAVGSGTDVAINAADLLVVHDDLMAVPAAIELARQTLRTIRGNLAWAFAYNVAAIPVAALGLLNPLVAGAAMALSSTFVVWNSSRIGRSPRRRWVRQQARTSTAGRDQVK